jgi:hypothetical protein
MQGRGPWRHAWEDQACMRGDEDPTATFVVLTRQSRSAACTYAPATLSLSLSLSLSVERFRGAIIRRPFRLGRFSCLASFTKHARFLPTETSDRHRTVRRGSTSALCDGSTTRVARSRQQSGSRGAGARGRPMCLFS